MSALRIACWMKSGVTTNSFSGDLGVAVTIGTGLVTGVVTVVVGVVVVAVVVTVLATVVEAMLVTAVLVRVDFTVVVGVTAAVDGVARTITKNKNKKI